MNALLLLACLGTLDDAPLVGRPVEWPFTEAIAGFVRVGGAFVCPFAVRSSASRRRVEARQAFTLVLQVEARGPVKALPQRPALRELPAFKLQFDIEDAGQAEASPRRWEWRWRLRPRGTWVREVPGVPFLFYNPDLKPAEKGYQLLWTAPLPLEVETAETDRPALELPPEVMEIPDSLPVPSSAPGWLLAVLVILAPPLACAAWLLVWRRLWPDAARLARLRQGRAARRALAALRRLPASGRRRAEAVATLLASYLRERLGRGSVNPTPTEARDVVREAGLPEALADRLHDAWARLDAVRFGPTEESGAADAAEVERVIADIEEGLCPPSS